MGGAMPAQSSQSAQNERRCRERLDRIRSRDSDALAQLYDETSSLLFGLSLRILNDSADAEEVVLDVYQHIWKSADTFDETRGTVWGWLVMQTRSRAIDRLRQLGTRRTREVPVSEGSESRSGFPDPEVATIFQEERTIVRRALDTLSSSEREAIELAFFRGLTHVEVAEALTEPLGTIKTRIRVGMRKLRDALAPVARNKAQA
jgi:RNA polymerase sigma-70 factor (ECF subfamily)